MKKFYNRQDELALLNKHFAIAKNNLIAEVITGRRRIGKTELIKKYIHHKPSLYFYVTKKSSQILLDDFTAILRERFSFLPQRINSWEDFLNIIFELSKKERLIVVFDEFQNFNFVAKELFSILQKKIDEYKNSVKLHLILVGSIQTLMENIFRQKEPLHGRIDNFIYLEGFSFSEVLKIAQDHKLVKTEDVFNLYSIFNGVAKYYDILEKFDLFEQTPAEILKALFISKDTSLYKEGENLLIQEFGRDYERYFDILFCLSIGKTKINEIAALMQLPSTTISKYLSVLLKKYKLIEKRNLKNKKLCKNNRYYLKDIFLRFWFRYVYKNFTKIEIGAYKPILQDFQQTFKTHQGLIFEELARNILYRKILEGKIDLNLGTSGKAPQLRGDYGASNETLANLQAFSNYWDKKYELDIYGEDKNSLFIGEIKLSANAVNKKLINKINEFVEFREYVGNKKIIKIIITFGRIKNPVIIKLLKQHNFYYFDFNSWFA